MTSHPSPSSATQQAPRSPTSPRPLVAYCGFTDTANVGDYALFEANRRLLPRLELTGARDTRSIDANLFGGGTLFPYSLRYGRYRRRRINVAMGIGVEDPQFAGRFGPATVFAMHWWRFRKLGVRGYRSQQILASYRLSSVVTGDTALALTVPALPSRPMDRVGICLVGEPMSRRGTTLEVHRELLAYCRRLLAEGLDVTIVPFCRTDLEASYALHRALDERTDVLAFWSPPVAESVDAFLGRLSGLRFLVAERLHAAVLAAVAGVPFAMLPYKPKCLDFVDTLPLDRSPVLDYSSLSADALWQRTRQALTDDGAHREQMAAGVDELRKRLTSWSLDIEELILAATRQRHP